MRTEAIQFHSARQLHYLRRFTFFGSAVTVTSTRDPFSSLASSPCSSVRVFSIRRFRYRRSAPSTAICALSGLLGRGDEMILATVPGRVTLGCSAIRARSRFSSAILADLAMRGFAISAAVLACIALLACVSLADSLFFFLCGIHLSSRRDASRAVPFCTVVKYPVTETYRLVVLIAPGASAAGRSPNAGRSDLTARSAIHGGRSAGWGGQVRRPRGQGLCR